MKTNKFLTMIGAAVLLTAASCSSDDVAMTGSSGNEVVATFNINTPGTFKTRAAGDGTTVDKVKCVVYDQNENEVTGLTQEALTINGKQATYSVSLVKGRSYRIVFFAYKDGNGVYDISDLKNITMNTDALKANAEDYDCFTNVVDISATETRSAINKNITLYRPVAQINLCSTAEDIANATKAGINIKESRITLTGNIYNKFNAYTGTATTYDGTAKGSGQVAGTPDRATFAMSPVLAGSGTAYPDNIADITVNRTTYKHIGMAYAFVGDYQQQNLTDVGYTWKSVDEQTNVETKFSNVPVQRNFRTNIYGSILTSPANFNITVDEDFESVPNGDNNYDADQITVSVSSIDELKNKLADLSSARGNATINIENDLTLESGDSWTPINVDGYHGTGKITINGNGHKISGLTDALFSGGFAGTSGIIINDLTLENMTVNNSTERLGWGAFIKNVDSMPLITLTNCHVKGLNGTFTGGARVGGLIGWTAGYSNPNDGPVDTYITIEGCSVENSSITANGSVGAIIGHAGNSSATYQTIRNCTIKDCTLKCTEANKTWRVGKVVGTANTGHLTISNITFEGNNNISQERPTTTPNRADASKFFGKGDYYGRFVPGETGTLIIDGNEIKQENKDE